MVGSTNPFNGDSSVAQTFTAPTSGGTLSFWYKVVCPDTVIYDWATATLRDNTTNTTNTVLAKTCTNAGVWSQASTSLTAGHSYTLTLVDHDDNYPGDPTYTLFDDVAIAPPVANPPDPIVNGGFESGNLSGWASTGVTTVVGAPHSGSYAARVGSTSPTNGDSSLSQTFTAPSVAAKISLWYKTVCPDTVTYDWTTATLRDNNTAGITTIVAKTCTNSGVWVNKSAALLAGHSYTLTLVNHDDNYPGDPTYTLFYDITVQGSAPVGRRSTRLVSAAEDQKDNDQPVIRGRKSDTNSNKERERLRK
jgi:hypothetical protein